MIETLKRYLAESNRIVFFGGAGVSTESGIPDFRSADGLYREKTNRTIEPEEILSHDFLYQHPREFYQFYREKMLYLHAKPNITHQKLAQWEADGKLLGIITQNIDGLHQKAGSKRVFELHGSVYRNYCTRCHEAYPVDVIVNAVDNYPVCSRCGGLVRPDVTLYGESLPSQAVAGALTILRQADLLIIGGTSLTVYPACNLIYDFCGEHLVVINREDLNDKTNIRPGKDLLFEQILGEVFSQL